MKFWEDFGHLQTFDSLESLNLLRRFAILQQHYTLLGKIKLTFWMLIISIWLFQPLVFWTLIVP